MILKIDNRSARRLWINAQELASPPTGIFDLLQTITRLGYVQLDTINNVTRAHHHILWSRNQNYRESMLNDLLAKERGLFEHFTHDASLLPIEFFPMWQRQFRRLGDAVRKSKSYKDMADEDRAVIKARIAAEGPLSTHAFDSKIEGTKEMWTRPPHKRALDHMWYAGELTTSHREKFIKYYDLTERIIPEKLRAQNHSEEVQLDWLYRAALDRLGFANAGEIQRFWAVSNAKETKAWIESAQQHWHAAEVQGADGKWLSAYVPTNIERRLDEAEKPTSRLRIINPFDPLIRDRDRLSRLFGFDYRIEIFVPAAKRVWGYYVYPLLEGDRFVGRIELKADKKTGTLNVSKFWEEGNAKWSSKRYYKLEAELSRFARFAGLETVRWVGKPMAAHG